MKSTKCCLRNAERLTPWFVAHTSDGYRGLIDNPRDREKIARDLNAQCGLTTISYFYSPSESCFVAIVEGTAKQVATVKMTSMASGGFLKMTSELLMSSADFLQSMQDSARMKFSAPNQDEIDRMLLEE